MELNIELRKKENNRLTSSFKKTILKIFAFLAEFRHSGSEENVTELEDSQWRTNRLGWLRLRFTL